MKMKMKMNTNMDGTDTSSNVNQTQHDELLQSSSAVVKPLGGRPKALSTTFSNFLHQNQHQLTPTTDPYDWCRDDDE
eukprot:m.14104 g.14104  ORF g.14104 m.14104 type:complete len:77 (+) comp10004_c1_seq1:1-231(+)